jgi:hypothetical protein
MDPADQVLLRLADPATRPSLLDADALLELAVTCYAVDPEAVTAPTTAVYDRFDLAVALSPESSLSARLMRAGDALPWDVSAAWDTGRPPTPGADAVMAGSLVVRTAGVVGLIETVDVVEVPVPADFSAAFDLSLQLSAPSNGGGDPPLVLPVVVAFLVDDGTSPRRLLQATAAARRIARSYPSPSPPDDAPARRADRAVCWLLPAAAFEDDGWPGGPTADARLAAARAWLGPQGIAVIVT